MYLPNFQIQTKYFFYSILLGVLIGIIYDFLRVIREAIWYGRKPKFYISDILIFIIAAFLFEIYTLAYGYGQIRYYALLGMCLGFILYLNTFGCITFRFEHGLSFFMNLPFIFFTKALKNLKILVYNQYVVFNNRLKMRKIGEQSEEGEEEQ